MNWILGFAIALFSTSVFAAEKCYTNNTDDVCVVGVGEKKEGVGYVQASGLGEIQGHFVWNGEPQLLIVKEDDDECTAQVTVAENTLSVSELKGNCRLQAGSYTLK